MILILQNLQIYHIKKLLPEYVVYQELSPEIQLLKFPNGKYTGRYDSNVDVRKRSDNFCYILFKYQDQNTTSFKEL